MKHTLSVLVENKPGVLVRVAGLFARRGFNIESLAVAPTESPDFSRMTIVVDGELHPIDQVTKQLHKLINVIKISDLDPKESVNREMVLMKVHAPAEKRSEIIELVDVFRAKIVDVAQDTMVIEVTGTEDKVNSMERLVRAYGIKEMARTGKIALPRGTK